MSCRESVSADPEAAVGMEETCRRAFSTMSEEKHSPRSDVMGDLVRKPDDISHWQQWRMHAQLAYCKRKTVCQLVGGVLVLPWGSQRFLVLCQLLRRWCLFLLISLCCTWRLWLSPPHIRMKLRPLTLFWSWLPPRLGVIHVSCQMCRDTQSFSSFLTFIHGHQHFICGRLKQPPHHQMVDLSLWPWHPVGGKWNRARSNGARQPLWQED